MKVQQTQDQLKVLKSEEKETINLFLWMSITITPFAFLFIPHIFGWIWLTFGLLLMIRAIFGYFEWNLIKVTGVIDRVETIQTGKTGHVGYKTPTGESYTQLYGPVSLRFTVLLENGKRVKVYSYYRHNYFLWNAEEGYEIEGTIIVTLYQSIIYKFGL